MRQGFCSSYAKSGQKGEQTTGNCSNVDAASAYARRALDALRIANEPAWQTVTAAYVEQRYPLEDGEPVLAATPGLRALFGLSFVERRIPVPFRLPAGLQQQLDMLERERKVRSALRAGKSKRRIAREQGVSMRKINRAVA